MTDQNAEGGTYRTTERNTETTTMSETPKLTDVGIELEDNPLVGLEEMRSDHNDHLEVVAETDDVVVFADHKGHELNVWSDELGVERGELSRVMHREARKHSDYNWSASDPLVIVRPSRSS